MALVAHYWNEFHDVLDRYAGKYLSDGFHVQFKIKLVIPGI